MLSVDSSNLVCIVLGLLALFVAGFQIHKIATGHVDAAVIPGSGG